jgi:hypothetical protein
VASTKVYYVRISKALAAHSDFRGEDHLTLRSVEALGPRPAVSRNDNLLQLTGSGMEVTGRGTLNSNRTARPADLDIVFSSATLSYLARMLKLGRPSIMASTLWDPTTVPWRKPTAMTRVVRASLSRKAPPRVATTTMGSRVTARRPRESMEQESRRKSGRGLSEPCHRLDVGPERRKLGHDVLSPRERRVGRQVPSSGNLFLGKEVFNKCYVPPCSSSCLVWVLLVPPQWRRPRPFLRL